VSAIVIDLTGPGAVVGTVRDPAWRRVVRAFRPTETKCVFALTAALYAVLGAVLVFRFGSIVGDALSRAANASYVIDGRDPHVAAIGFDWMPLPSVAMIPFLLLRPWWPAIASAGFASNLVSALCMAGAVTGLRGILEDLGLRSRTRLVLVALFALHPMILYYGANGMSEAAMLCTLLAGTRPLMRWLHDDDPVHLAPAGISFGLAYLTRYEGLVAGIGAVGVVALVSWVRAGKGWRVRRSHALADVAVVGVPIGASWVLWSFTRWLIMGQAFMSYNQVYGSESDVAHLQDDFARLAHGHGFRAYELYRLTQTGLLAPLLPLALAVAAFLALRRRDARLLAPITSLVSVLVFEDFFFDTGGSYGWLRFSITAVPLLWICAALPLAGRAALPRPDRLLRRLARRATTVLLTLLAIAMVVPAIPAAAGAMVDMRLAREEAPQLRAMGDVLRGQPRDATLRRWDDDRVVADAIASMHLPHGAVLLDATDGFAIVLASPDPSTYVITPDRDFKATLADPALWGVEYLLVAPTPNHVVAKAYPTLYDDGGGIASFVREFPEHYGGYTWRLYRVGRSRTSVG
jgi:hypothetical protein